MGPKYVEYDGVDELVIYVIEQKDVYIHGSVAF